MPLESKRERNERIGNDPNTPHICFFLIMLLNMLIAGFIAYILFMQKKEVPVILFIIFGTPFLALIIRILLYSHKPMLTEIICLVLLFANPFTLACIFYTYKFHVKDIKQDKK